MRHFDGDFVEDALRRLHHLDPQAKPASGRLESREVIPRLLGYLKYSMGRHGHMPYRGNWFTRHIVGPLVLHGLLPFPENDCKVASSAPGGIEALETLLHEYLGLVQAGEFSPKVHPSYGDIGVDGWARMHVHHFEHRMKQFRL